MSDCATLHNECSRVADTAEEKLAETTKMILKPKPNRPQPHSVSTGSIATIRELRECFRPVVLVA